MTKAELLVKLDEIIDLVLDEANNTERGEDVRALWSAAKLLKGARNRIKRGDGVEHIHD